MKKIISKIKRLVSCTYLCWKYPFLKYRWEKDKFFQTSCWYYSIDIGWRKAFGLQLCEEIKQALIRHDFLYKYNITDIKEKMGELVIYDDGAPEEVHDIIFKYGYISSRTCFICGRPAKYRTRGWIEPYCEDCIKEANTTKEPDEAYKDFEWYGWKK